ncbi:hypothetical protein ACFX15_037443 [Malus domestica]|uniref:Tubby C-terminal domain-containing protein n=1 Tax=Malus domestica TaxID=3750 RepID=A0A498JNW0_MALDO|nr:hypothetical protein DVH24_008024 [Malus domestica]
MAKVHSLNITPTTTCSSNEYMTSKRETFTIWMKSLVMQGNGCTAFDENGELVYRIDNYDDKHSNEVYLMDLRGKLLFSLCEKKMSVFPSWNGYQSNDIDAKKPIFQVRKSCKINLGNKDYSYKVTMGSDSNCYRLEGLNGKSSSPAFRIRDNNGGVVAEAKRKQSSSGVVFGDDVLTLVVEPHVDHSFVMALVTVYGLIRHQI